MKTLIVTLAVLLGPVLLWVVWAFNRLVRGRNQMREGWSGIEVQLKRRHDLVPGLVECVKGMRDHERELLEEVVRERSVARKAEGPAAAGGAESELGAGIGRLVALAEGYPELKADGQFRKLMEELVEIEDQIQFARRYYNGSVRDLNNLVESFPTNLVARAGGFRPGEYFEVEHVGERHRVEVEL
jgi:LemA protein